MSLVVGVPTAGAVDATASVQQVWGTVGAVDITPVYPAASNTSTVSGAITGINDYLGNPVANGTSVAVSFCGNFTQAGTPLTEAEQNTGTIANAGQAYCDGTEDLVSFTLPFLSTTGNSLSFTKTLRSGTAAGANGIGNEQAQCLAGGLTTCKIAIATTANTNPSGQNFAVKIPIFGGPAPSATSVTASTQAGRAGATINFTGVDYDASVSTGTAALCDSNGTTGCQALTGTSISTNGSGALTGSGAVPSGATTGARKLVVSTSTKTASTDYLVLGAAAINLSASSGAAGGSVVVSGSNFDPGKTLFVSPTNGSGPTGSVAVVTTSATGTFSGASVTTNTGTVAITATVNPPDGINLASQPFTVSANSCVAVAAGGTTGSCSISQTLQETITGGELKMSQSAGLVALSGTTLNGTNQTATGSLNQVTVTDSRGTLGGWTLTGNVTDLTTGVGADANHTLPAASITWTPACAATTGTSAEVAPGAAGGIASATLCQAAAGGGGGVFTADAGISVPVPATKAAGLYSGTLTLTLTGL